MNSDRDLDKLTEELFAEAKNERPTEAVKERVLATVLKTPTPGAGAHATSTWMWWVGAASLLAMGLAIGLSGTSGAEAPAPPSAPSLLVVEADPAPSLPPGPAEPAVTATPVDAREGPPAPRVAPRSQPAPRKMRSKRSWRCSMRPGARSRRRPPKRSRRSMNTRSGFPVEESLKTEADLLRVEALVNSGRRAEAVRLGKRLSGSQGTGPLVERVQRIREGVVP